MTSKGVILFGILHIAANFGLVFSRELRRDVAWLMSKQLKL